MVFVVLVFLAEFFLGLLLGFVFFLTVMFCVVCGTCSSSLLVINDVTSFVGKMFSMLS